MGKYVVYAHSKLDPESDLIYVCTCDTKDVADSIKYALKYRDTGGRCDDTGFYDYMVRFEDWIK